MRNQLSDPVFRKVFPNCHISEDSTAKHHFNTQEGGVYIAVGRGGSVTGKGADLFILDDMLKDHTEATSKITRENLKDWYRSVATTRLQKDAAVVLGGTRWHEDDLIGWVLRELKDQDWVVVNYPARSETGHPLWLEMFDDAALTQIEKTLGPYFWNALYMQRPSPQEGNILKKKWWQFYEILPQKFDEVIQSWDLSFKEKQKSSFVVGQVWGRTGPNCYLIDQFRNRASFTESLFAIARLTENYPKARTKLIEDKANGPAVINVLQRKMPGIVPVEPQGTKEERAHAITHMIESGNVYLPDPKIKLWVQDFIDECTNFPNGEHDDQVDAMTQALARFGDKASSIQSLKDFLAM